ncbi:MAG TPA: hypothetical protein VFY40_11530 [Blastocatellia bacterium]|nr:hypothetical protein [Blastocatellia bacterium]
MEDRRWKMEDRGWKMAILDLPSSILDPPPLYPSVSRLLTARFFE